MSGIDIEGVLSAHAEVRIVRHPANRRGIVRSERVCTCGEALPWTPDVASVQHRAHVAAVLRERIEGALAEARSAALLELTLDLVDWLVNVATDPSLNRDWLAEQIAARAAHLSDTERAGGAG